MLSKGAYATLWDVKPKEKSTNARISVSRKNKDTGKYEQTFNHYVMFVGQAHDVVKELSDKDRVKINDFKVGTNYDKEKKITYVNFIIPECEQVGDTQQSGSEEKNPF